MSKKTADLTGQRFDRWLVLSFHEYIGHNSYYKCQCDCGTIKNVCKYSLTKGVSRSCGCYNGEEASKRAYKHGQSYNPTKKETGREYMSWQRIKAVCLNPEHEHYKYYGGRGITVCDRWANSFVDFLSDMGKCPKGYTIERVDVNGNYELSNCIWIPSEDQPRNRTTTVWLEYKNERMILADWARRFKVKSTVIQYQLTKKTFEEIANTLS